MTTRLSTQDSDIYPTASQSSPRKIKLPLRVPISGGQGEFSGMYDKEGHHLKSDGSKDMRYKENRDDKPDKPEKSEKPQSTEKLSSKTKHLRIKTSPTKQEIAQTSTTTPSKTPTHIKADQSPDMRYKENREKYSGMGYEGSKTRTRTNRFTFSPKGSPKYKSSPISTSPRLNKTNIGLYEGNTPGEHSGKYDKEMHHLKNDGTPDMRYKENREVFSGQGYEHEKVAKYKLPPSEYTNKSPSHYKRRRPPTPYAIYIRENASDMKRENPEMDMNQVFRELAKVWRGMSDKKKKTYYDIYADEVEKWEGEKEIIGVGMSKYKSKRRGDFGSKDSYNVGKRGKNVKVGNVRDENMEVNEEDENYNHDENESDGKHDDDIVEKIEKGEGVRMNN